MSASVSVPTFQPPSPMPAPRAFALTPEDLDVDFNERDRAALVTTLLALCCANETQRSAVREDAAWNLSLSARIARLLRIVELTTESETLPLTRACPNAGCRQPFELALPFATLLAGADEFNGAEKIVQFPLENSASISLRLPTGRDQSEWRNQRYQDQTAALFAIVRSLAIEPVELPTLSAEQLAPLAAAMEAADPLVAFTIHTSCPHCERRADIAVDLEAAALSQLVQSRRAALRDVHDLATHYGWTERDVLAIPPRRRVEYKKFVAAGEQTHP